MRPLLLEGVPCFQVVFTIPADLSSLTLGNRRLMFNLLFRSAWLSLKTVLEDEQQFAAAAAMALHTWNQKLDAHVHVHAVVPGGGPSLTTRCMWRAAKPPPHERSGRPWLCDADDLRHEFRGRFLTGLRRLHRAGELKLEGDWQHLQDAEAFEEFIVPLEQQSWVTYIEPPPSETSEPADVVKYLARYLTGGPISDRRIIAHDGRTVTFTARAGTTHGGSDETEDVDLSVLEFVRRWCLHILPAGFSRSRRFGGWSPRHRERYVAQCRQLLCLDAADSATTDRIVGPQNDVASSRACPECGSELERLERVFRTSWREIFGSEFCPAWYRTRERGG